METEIEEKEQQLLDPELYGDYTKASELNEELEAHREKLDMLMEEWTELQT